MIQSQENFRTEGLKDRKTQGQNERTEGHTLIHRTLPAEARGRVNGFYMFRGVLNTFLEIVIKDKDRFSIFIFQKR